MGGGKQAGIHALHYKTMQVFFHDLLRVAVAFKSHVLRVADINVMGHISDGCIVPTRVTIALVFDPVGRLMQLVCAPRIWAL